MHIHIQWDGPYNLDRVKSLRDDFTDYGVYSVYGTHPVYGSNVLLYIGMANQQTFGVRLAQETGWQFNQDAARLEVHVGRLYGYEGTPSNEQWAEQIRLAEKLLILAHWPAANSSGLNVQLKQDVYDLHIFNWGNHRNLLPEVSGARYSDRYAESIGYAAYGESRRSV